MGLGPSTSGVVRYDEEPIHRAIEHLINTVKDSKHMLSVHSPDLASAPGLLETLIRRDVDILCVHQREFGTVQHVVNSLESKIKREKG